MTLPDPSNSNPSRDERPSHKQSTILAAEMHHWLELFDTKLAEEEIPLWQRPLHSLIMLLHHRAIEFRAGEVNIDDASKLSKQCDQPWFRALYAAVEHWYIDHYSSAAIKGRGSVPLDGVVFIRKSPFALRIPANRVEVEAEGETAWVYFDEDVSHQEEVEKWIVNCPDLSKLSQDARRAITYEATKAASTLRFVQFRRIFPHKDICTESQQFVAMTLMYLQSAAGRLVSNNSDEWGPAWFDLQMTNESALKAAAASKTGKYQTIHPLTTLFKDAADQGVVFDEKRLEKWPHHKRIIAWRYGQDRPPGTQELYAAYQFTLDLVRASLQQLPASFKPGFGMLLNYAPWKPKNAAGFVR